MKDLENQNQVVSDEKGKGIELEAQPAVSCQEIEPSPEKEEETAKEVSSSTPKKRREKLPKACRRTSIGGQAVLEGVMMKGARSTATAVRAPSGEITVESKYIKSAKERNVFFRLPFVRGVVNLISQLFQGTGIIMRSAEVYGDYAEPTKFDKWVAKKLKINPMNILMGFSVILGIVLAVGLFVLLPNVLAGLICDNTAIDGSSLRSLWYSLIEGGLMLVIFICYILLVSLLKDIRRVFMYHGAEHKVISCYEHGLDLTVENAKKMPREHSRCGTTFLFFVVAVSIIVFVLINFMLDKCGLLVVGEGAGVKVLNALIRLGFKLLFLPVVAGVSYEWLKLLAKSDCLVVRILRAPGMLLQKLTTKEPTEDMLEVSLTAFKTVMEMDENPNLPERQFDIKVPYDIARKRLLDTAEGADEADIDWLLVDVLKVKRSELEGIASITKAQYDCAMEIAKKMADGRPLQYALGTTEFYGIKLSVNQNVLIPRQETEELVEKVVEDVRQRGGADVLDLCTGSGAIAIAVAKNTNANVKGYDISDGALGVANANALNAGIKVAFAKSDMWNAVCGKYDIITCNPPYIPTNDINSLENKVKNFEPTLALDGGEDGLKYYRIFAEKLGEYLKDGGRAYLEFGINQAESLKEIFADYNVEIVKDIAGIERILILQKKD